MLKNINIRSPLLTVGFLLGIIFVLISLAIWLKSVTLPSLEATFTRQPTARTRTLRPTNTPTIPQSPTSSPRPTWTLRPSSTVTITPTPTQTRTATLRPTLTQARPLINKDLYRLVEWSPDLADRAIQLLDPELLFPTENDRQDPEYQATFELTNIALREALLRFPEDPRALHWRWVLAYNLAHLNDPQAGAQYTDLTTEALRSRQTNLDSLSGWFSKQETHLDLDVVQLPPIPGYLSNQIIEIKGQGGIYIWLLESPNGFQTYLLDSHFDYINGAEPQFTLGDLTGDSSAEIAIYSTPSSGNSDINPPRVFDLSQMPPKELRFEPSSPFKFSLDHPFEWKIVEDSSGLPQLKFSSVVFPSCPVEISRAFSWKGAIFKAGEIQFQIHPVQGLAGYCELIADHASLVWGPEATIRLMVPLSPEWPPDQNAEGKPYPQDARDEWSYKLGIQYALAGHPDEAKRVFNAIITGPSSPNSRWVEPAKRFLATYKSPDDLYRACIEAETCNPRLALQKVVETVSISDYDLLPAYFQQFGVPVRSSGIFDFENDGEPERWITVQHEPTQLLEFWILARVPGAISALYIDQIDTATPTLHFYDPEENPPTVQWKTNEGFILGRVPEIQIPYITHVDVEFRPTTYTKDILQNATVELFENANPTGALNMLVNLLESGQFNCKNYQICDRFYYLIGLGYELAGNKSEAINWYLKLWWEQRNSPMTILARLKLATRPTSTPTASKTPTQTNIPTISSTPTVTNTRNPFATPSLTPTITLTPTETEEIPYP